METGVCPAPPQRWSLTLSAMERRELWFNFPVVYVHLPLSSNLLILQLVWHYITSVNRQEFTHTWESFLFSLACLQQLHQFHHPQRKGENKAINPLGQSLFMFLDNKRNPEAISSSRVNAKKASRIIDDNQKKNLTIRIFSCDQLLQLIQLCRNGGM